MKWWPAEPQRGDMIRVALGSIYHYGIFIDEDTVVQFGPPPGTPAFGNGAGLRVCTTTADEFSCGRIIETAVLDKKEEKKRIPREQSAAAALSRIGEEGYDILRNNCEHFAYECVFGIKRCTQEEEARRRWNSRPILDCYFGLIPADLTVGHVVPEERDALIASTGNERLRRERYYVWQLLGAAVSRSFGYRLEDLDLHREACGRWCCGALWLSLTHTDGLAAVAVSNAPVGIDAECSAAFTEKYASQARKLGDKLLTRRERRQTGAWDTGTLLTCWTRKESIFKSLGEPEFHPDRIEAAEPHTASLQLAAVPGYVCAVHGEKLAALRCYIYADGRTSAAGWEEIGLGKK